MSRKKTILTILFCIATAGGLVVNLTFLRTTIAYKELKSFCIQNSEIDASSFSCFELDSYLNYSFWVSEDKKSDQQELFVFYKKYPFGKRMNLSFQAATKKKAVGNALIFLTSQNSKYSVQPLVVYYSSNPEQIVAYTLTITEGGNSRIIQGTVERDRPFLIDISDIPIGCEELRCDIAFFDINNILIDSLSTFISTNYEEIQY